MRKVDCTLRFKSIETEEECDKLREILSILDIKYIVKRRKDIDDKIVYVKEKGSPSKRSLPYDFYDYGLQAYLFGLDIATVIYCFSAVEMMLTFLLRTKRNANHRIIRGLKSLIKKACNEGLLDEEHSKIANDLRVLRNYYVHFVNHAEVFNELYHNAIELTKSDLEAKKRESFLAVLEEFHGVHTKTKFLGMKRGKIRDEDMRRFLDCNEKRYQKWRRDNRYGILELRDFGRIRHFSINRFNALSAIEWTSKILHKLEEA